MGFGLNKVTKAASFVIFKLGVDLVLCCLVCPQVCIVPKVRLDRRVVP